MSDTLSEIDGQHVELLPARTVMSLFTVQGGAVGGGFGGVAAPIAPIAPIMPVMPLSGLFSNLTGGGSGGLFLGTTGAVGSGSGGLFSGTTGYLGSGSRGLFSGLTGAVGGPLAPVAGLLSGVTER